MSLVDQSQQWYPTSVQVTVLQARSLRIKGKNGTNDAYAIMQVAKDKYSTSVVEKTVTPVWKEEATFELPLFHNGSTDNCTLHVHVMHRALMGPDKLLGQAVINLLELSEVKSHNKTEWYKLLDKAGKPDKERGQVLVAVQFMRNNMTASMFDLSATDKPRSRLGKLKDKVRGKKKEGLSDSASAVVPSFTQVLTDSEGEGEANGEESAGKEKKKKNKLKSLFSTKSNLQRQGLSQSMSVLGPLPEKNTSLSGSRSSGLNVDTSEGKTKFKFLSHKRTGSSDSKASQGTLSLGRSKIPLPLAEQSNLCINGSHVYAEQPQNRRSTTGSTASLASSGHDSTEDLRWPENSAEEEDEEEERGRMEEEVKREGEYERKKLEEEQERMRREEQERMRREEQERMRREEQERMRREEQERMRREEQERMRREEQEKKRTREEEMERLRFEEEERRLEEEEEERKRTEEEESRKKEEQEKRRRMEEQEKIRLEEERRILEEKESMQRLKVEEEERMRKEEQERRRLEEKRREMEEQEKLEEEERLRRDEHERMKREDRLRKEEERKMREKEEQLKREKEERTKEEEDRIRRKEKEDVLRREEQRKMEEEERRREDEEIIKREKEAERQREEEERGKKEVEIKRMKEEERLRREEEDRQQMDEERRFREEKRQKKEEEERRIMEEEMQKREEEERRIGEEEMQKKEERLRKEEEERLEVTQKEEAERKKLDEEREREEKQRRTLMEANERLRVEQENKKKDELRRQEERLREEEKMRNVQMKGKVQLQEVEKQLEYRREATVSNNPFEEVSSSPLSDDTFTNDPFEETPTVPVSCRTNKVSAVKPRPSSWGNTPQPCASSSPFRSSSSMDSLRSNVETSGLQDPSTDVRKTKNPTPLLYNIQSCKDDSHISTTNIAVTKPTKPPPPPRRQPSTSLVDGSGDQGSVTGPDHPSVRQNKDVATLPPDSQRWPSKDKRPGKSNCHSASPTLTPTKTTNPLPPPPRRHSATSLIGSRNDHPLLQSNSKDQTNTRRDKHPAPPPPGRSSQAPSQTQNNQSMTGVNHGPKGTVGASVSTVSQCVVQITPLIPSEDTTEQTGGGQSFTHFGKQAEKLIPSDAENMMVAKHNKGPAPSRPKYPPEKVKPNADIVDKQSHTDEHNSSVVFDQNNPFAEDCRRESLCGGSEEQIKTLVSTHAASGPLQKSLCGDTIDLPRVEFGPAKDPSRTTSAKRVRAPLPPGSKLCTPREEEAVEPSCVKSQSSGAPAPNKLSSSVLVKTQNRGVGVALPCVIVAQSSSAPSPPISSPPHPEPLKASEGRTHPTPQTTHTVSGPKSRLHAVPLPIIRQCSGEDAGGTGGRSASSTIRPHPVKPLNSPENQPAPNMQESQPGKTTEKVKDTEVRGPYSQLTQEELISLVMKQQEQLSNRDNKIKELEQYIDNLLVRILDEHPSILMSMNSHK